MTPLPAYAAGRDEERESPGGGSRFVFCDSREFLELAAEAYLERPRVADEALVVVA